MRTGLLLLVLLLGMPALVLPAGPAALVDRYGDPLPEGTIARLGTVRFRDPSVGEAIAYSPDGTRIATGNRSGLSIWDAGTGRRVRALTWEPPQTNRGRLVFAFSSDGKHLAYWWGDGQVRVAAVGHDETHTLNQDDFPVRALAFTQAEECFVAVGPHEIRVLPKAGGLPRQVCLADLDADPEGIRWPAPRFEEAALSPDGKVLAVTCLQRGLPRTRGFPRPPHYLRLWDVATGEELARLNLRATQVAFRPDGSVLAALVGSEIVLLDPFSGERVGAWDAPVTDGGGKLMFSPDGSLLSANGRLYDVATREALREIEPGWSLAFSPDGRSLATAPEFGGAVVVRDVRTNRPTLPLAAHVGFIQEVHALPDGRRIATMAKTQSVRLEPNGEPRLVLSGDGAIRLWDAATGKPLGEVESAGGETFAFAGRWVAHASAGRVEVNDLETGRRAGVVAAGRERAHLALSADGQTLLYRPVDARAVQVYDVATGTLRQRLPLDHPGFSAMALSPNGAVAAVASVRGALRLWDTTTGRLRIELEREHGPELHTQTMLAFSPDGRLLASCRTVDGDLRLWDVASGRLVRIGPGHGRLPDGEGNVAVTALAFSPDGRLLVTAAQDYTNCVWEVASLRERFRWNASTWAVALVGRHLLVTSNGQTDALVHDLAALADTAPREAKALWAMLADHDPAKAYGAGRALTAMPDTALALLKDHLHPIRPIDPARLRAWIADLDADDFDTRDRAANELARLGEAAVPSLTAARQAATSVEQRRRLDDLLTTRVGPLHPDRLRTLRAIEVLEDIATAPARALLESLAQGVPDAAETQHAKAALKRLR